MFDSADTSRSREEAGPPGHRTRVKICGLTCVEDAALAIELGADALGFNFYPGSSRFLDCDTQTGWLRDLPASVQRVAVVVNATQPFVERLIRERLVDSIQLHGDEEEGFCSGLRETGIRFSKAIRVRDLQALERPERFQTADLLLDAYQQGAFGGTGHRVDWALAAEFTEQQSVAGRRVILSGGLTPENVAEAVLRVNPFAVDVASGVEELGNPRRKSATRLRAFIAAVREADGEKKAEGRR